MYTSFITIFAFILSIFILVAVHEYGHFKVARLCNVKVLKFCIGFGPAIFKRKDKHNTEFILAPIPLGGYVKMLDEREGEVAIKDKPYEFNNKKPWQKMAIVAAGPIFNFILAVAAFFVMFLYGIQVERPIIQYVEPNSIAAQSGVLVNHEIVAVDNVAVSSFADVQVALAARLGTVGDVVITTKKFEYQSTDLALTDVNTYALNITNLITDINKEPITQTLGLWLWPKNGAPLLIDSITVNSNADLGKLKPYDVITSYNNNKIEQWDDFLKYIKTNPDKKLLIEFTRDGVVQKTEIKIGNKINSETNKQEGYLGVSFRYPLYFAQQNYGILESFNRAVMKTYNYTVQTFYMIYKLIVGHLGLDTVRGPVMVAKAAGMQIQMGLSNFLNFLGIVSIGLGVVNLLPIPVLDGGHLVYHLYELIIGRRVSERTEKVSLMIGLFILALIMSVAFYNDFRYW